jgi:hypothetical protein
MAPGIRAGIAQFVVGLAITAVVTWRNRLVGASGRLRVRHPRGDPALMKVGVQHDDNPDAHPSDIAAST